MPELPDVEVYLTSLRPRVVGHALRGIELASPFVLRTVEPRIEELVGRTVVGLRRIGKRIVFGFEGELFLVLHPMIAGRLKWRDDGRRPPGGKRAVLARLEFATGTLWLTEASTKKRSALHVVAGEAELQAFDAGGVDPLDADAAGFEDALQRENRTLKRALTDPRLFSGIGNAYSDEILFAARLSPLRLTSSLDRHEVVRLFEATQRVLREWTARLAAEVGEGFPEHVTAFRDGMAVHGRYREPCVECGAPIQRIRYAENECNYCARCQNAGRLLADRGLSQLMRKDWPRTLEELEERRRPIGG